MRILHVAPSLLPETHGGTQQYVSDLAQLQRHDGHEVAVLAGARSDAAVAHAVQDGVEVWRLLRQLPQEALSGDLGSERIGVQLVTLAAAWRPDVVHVHHWANLTNDVVQRLAGLGAPVLLTLHDLFVTCARSFRMPDHRGLCRDDVDLDDCARCLAGDLPQYAAELPVLLQARAANFARELAAAAAVLCVSEAQRQKLAAVGCRPARLAVLPIGIRSGAPLPPPALAPGRLRLCNWAGLDPRKGLHVLLAALAGSEQRAHFELHVHGRAGEVDYMQELQRLGQGLSVHYHGAFADGAFWQFGASYDLAVFPSLAFETHGLMVDEALLAGLPVLCSDLGAPPSRLGGRGATFPAGDAAALRQLLERLLAAPDDLLRLRRAPHGATDLESHHRQLLQRYRELPGHRPDGTPGR